MEWFEGDADFCHVPNAASAVLIDSTKGRLRVPLFLYCISKMNYLCCRYSSSDHSAILCFTTWTLFLLKVLEILMQMNVIN
ncbi:CLUMA_CG014602, isoform A [Clunio marinus]|uniref:CLUMA_CG014602, isoform A n=1 Tax=Clunio marinus TaxID=568069 RepID=A0A1J1IMT9_9DIPT|nr:CLUMA_CG014602, isoform A [Clunio marinus]